MLVPSASHQTDTRKNVLRQNCNFSVRQNHNFLEFRNTIILTELFTKVVNINFASFFPEIPR